MSPEPSNPGAHDPRVASVSLAGGERLFETSRAGGLLEKHQAGVREASSELTALVVAEIRRAAPAQHRDSGAPPEEQLTNLIARVLSDCAIAPKDRAPFLTIYARAVRQVVCARLAEPGIAVVTPPADPSAPSPEMILALDRVLQALEEVNGRLVSVVECLYFARLTEEETATALRAEVDGVRREWLRARAWLLKELTVVAGATPREVSVTNAVWVDAVLRTAVGMAEPERAAFLEGCHAASPGLREDVEALLRLSDPATPGPSPGDISAAYLWDLLASVRADIDDDRSLPLRETLAGIDPACSDPQPLPTVLPIDYPAEHASTASPTIGGWRVDGEWTDSPLGAFCRVAKDGYPAGAFARVLPILPAETLEPEFVHRVSALAALPSPPFARILDSGADTGGRLFVVRERIEGRPIDAYCDELQLNVRDRVRLMIRVCVALQLAHRRLLAHGLVSTSQTLIDDLGELRFVDAGIVPLIAAIQGQPTATVESDVYQAGALLCELLVAERLRPTAASQVDIARVDVRPSDIARSLSQASVASRGTSAAALARLLRGDMDAIVRTALHEDVERRYPSIGALAADLQRWLDGRPVSARRPTVRYVASKFIARQRVLLSAALAVLVLIAALMGWSATRRADSSTSIRFDGATQLLADVFDSDAPGTSMSRSHLDRAAALARSELAAQPRARGTLLLGIGRSYAAAGLYQSSIDVMEEALTDLRSVSGDNSTEVADALEARAAARLGLGRLDEAEADFRGAADIRRARSGAADAATLSATIGLATVLHAGGRFADAESLLRRVVPTLGANVMDDSTHPDLVPRTQAALATVLRDRGVLAESEELFRRALASPVATSWSTASRPRWLAAFADLLVTRGRFEEAETVLAEARAAFRRSQSANHLLLLEPLVTEARLRLEQGRLDAARDLLQEALRMQQELIKSFHPIVPTIRTRQAELARREGRLDEAIDSARLALDEFARLGLDAHPSTIEARSTLADALIASNRRSEAVPVLQRALMAAAGVVVPDDVRMIRLRGSLAAASGGAR